MFELSQLHKLIMKLNLMVKYINYQAPKSEWCLFYPILLIWTGKNDFKYLLNLLCNTAAMVPCSHMNNWETWCSTQLLWFAPLFIHIGKKNRIKDQFSSLFQSVCESPLRLFLFFLWCGNLQGPWCTICDYRRRTELMPLYWKPGGPMVKPFMTQNHMVSTQM